MNRMMKRIEELEAAANAEDAGAFVVDIGDEDDPALIAFRQRYPNARTVDIGGTENDTHASQETPR